MESLLKKLDNEKKTLDNFLDSDIFSTMENLIDRLNFDLLNLPQNMVKSLSLSRNNPVEALEPGAILLEDVQDNDNFKVASGIIKYIRDDIALPQDSQFSDTKIPDESFVYEQYISSINEFHKITIVDFHRPLSISGKPLGTSKLLILDEIHPNMSLFTKPWSLKKTVDQGQDFQPITQTTKLLDSLKSHAIYSMHYVSGRKIFLVYKPENRTKSVGLSVVNYGSEVGYAIKYYPLTTSTKDQYQGQFVKVSADRWSVAVREMSTALRVVHLENVDNWGASELSLKEIGHLIKVEDFIKDFCIQNFEIKQEKYIFVSILLKNSKIRFFYIKVKDNKCVPIANEYKDNIGKEPYVEVIPSNYLGLGLECKRIGSKENEIGLFLMGLAPDTDSEIKDNTEFVPSIKGWKFVVNPETKTWTINSLKLSNTRPVNLTQNIGSLDLSSLLSRRMRLSTSIISHQNANGSLAQGNKEQWTFIGCMVLPEVKRMVIYSWKMDSDSHSMQDYDWLLIDQNEESSAHVYPMFFEEYAGIRETNIAPNKNVLCVLTKNSLDKKEKDKKIPLGCQTNLYF